MSTRDCFLQVGRYLVAAAAGLAFGLVLAWGACLKSPATQRINMDGKTCVSNVPTPVLTLTDQEAYNQGVRDGLVELWALCGRMGGRGGTNATFDGHTLGEVVVSNLTARAKIAAWQDHADGLCRECWQEKSKAVNTNRRTE